MAAEFKLPELGENVASGTVVKILVSKGDEIKKDQAILELETEKALLEVPADSSGTIKEIRVKEGEEVKVGQTILVLDGKVEGKKEKAEQPSKEKEDKAEDKEKKKEPVEEKEEKPEEKEKKKERDEGEKVEAAEKEAPKEKPEEEDRQPVTPAKPSERKEIAPAAPSTRRFAREIGIDINTVSGSGPGGRISIDDVKAFAKQINQQKAAPTTGLSGIAAEPLPDFTKWGELERKPMSKIRQATAKHLSFAWTTIPHVTQFDKADITELEKLRKQYGKKVEAAGGKLTVTSILLKIIGSALKVFPQFNASLDMAKNEIIYKKYYHIGIAVDTEHGLLVPVIRNVDRKNIIELSVELTQVAEKARNRKLSLDDMQGGNFSISNLGGIGGTAFTPVVNAPEVAILGISRGQMEPIYLNGNFEPRLMLPLSLSYDHRLIDGADAARFLRWVAEAIEQPFRVVLEG